MKVLVIGSGPIVIGQAAEFDYAGTQACKSLKEEGHEVVLINSNPATIMTDPGVSDALYIEPLNVDFCERVIARERPDALLPTLGGQTGLNLAVALNDAGIIERYGLKVLGTPLSAIRKAEDREQFRALMREIQEPVPESWIIESEEQLEAALDVVPYPCIIRPAYTLGGTGGGIASDREELWETGRKGLKLSMRSQIMVERSLLGWKEVEYEVMRDSAGNCITVCNMENLDPMGVHTGDSIVVAPSQTLSDLEYHMMRTASLKIINALGIEGGCNVQMALNPESFDYYIIEVNPRVSRSSALASKATGYPIARVAAKIAVGLTLDQIQNQVTGTTKACFEPALDYCVVKIPRWPFDKFASGDRTLFTQMKATGEVMAIDRSFEAALMKAIRGLEVKQKDLRHAQWHRHPADASHGLPAPDLEAVERRKGAYLPHWEAEGGTYFVTFRLADSVPEAVLAEWLEERRALDRLWEEGLGSAGIKEKLAIIRERASRFEAYLDAGAGSCLLHDQRCAGVVEQTLRHFDGERYRLLAWCVMPNHVHAVFTPLGEHRLPDILHSWKYLSAKRINEVLGRSGEVWQKESYDHLVRSQADLDRVVDYTRSNPSKAGLYGWEFVGPRQDGAATHRLEADATGQATQADATILKDAIRKPTDERLWALVEGLRRGWSIQEVNLLSRVDPWFLQKIKNLVDMEQRLLRAAEARAHTGREGIELSNLIYDAFLIGYPSPTILDLLDAQNEDAFAEFVRREVDRLKVMPVFKMVDTCAGEFESRTPYYYGTYDQEDDALSRV